MSRSLWDVDPGLAFALQRRPPRTWSMFSRFHATHVRFRVLQSLMI